MRNNAEHFNEPDRDLEPELPRRASLERAYVRAHEAEALARHCVARFAANPELWPHFDDDAQVDAFWKKQPDERAALWGERLDLEGVVAKFDARMVQDEEN